MSKETSFRRAESEAQMEEQNNGIFKKPILVFILIVLGVITLASQIKMPEWAKEFFWKETKIESKKSKPPHEQPDYQFEPPIREHLTKNPKLLQDWMLQIREGSIVVKLNPPSGPGEEFDEESFWINQLKAMVSLVKDLREKGHLFRPADWVRVCPGVLSTIVSTTAHYNLGAHNYLERALGEGYTLYISFVEPKSSKGAILMFFWVLHEGTTWFDANEYIKSLNDDLGEYIGLIELKDGQEKGRIITNYEIKPGEDPWGIFGFAELFYGEQFTVENPPPKDGFMDYRY